MMFVKKAQTQTFTPVAETGNKCFLYTAETQHRSTKLLRRPCFHIPWACVIFFLFFFNFAGVHARTESANTLLLVQECEVLSGRRQNKPGLAYVKFWTDGTNYDSVLRFNIPTKTHRSWSYRPRCGPGPWWCPEPCSQARDSRCFSAARRAHHHRCTRLCPDLHEQENKMSEHIVMTTNSTMINCSGFNYRLN